MSGNGRRCGGVAGESAHAERPEISAKASLAVEFRLARFRAAGGFHVADENAAFHTAAEKPLPVRGQFDDIRALVVRAERIADLQAAINRFFDDHNAQSKPFQWLADPDKNIAAVRRGRQALDSFR